MLLPQRKKNKKNPKSLSFGETRTTNDAAMIPDRGFTKQLKTLDKELDVVWDWGSEKWEIWKFPEGKDPYLVTRIQTKNKTYRELGADVLLNLQMHIQIGPDKIIDYLDEHNNQVQRRKMEAFRNKIQAIALDAWGPLFTISSQVPINYNIKVPKYRRILGVV